MSEKNEREPELPILKPAKKPSYPDITKFESTCGNKIYEDIPQYIELEKERQRQITEARKRGVIGITALTDYIPHITDPVKIICLNFHIFRDSIGQNHYQTSEIHRPLQIVRWVNDRFEFGENPSDQPIPASMAIKDTRLRFKLKNIYFYEDDILNVSFDISALQAAAVARDASTLDQVNVYFTMGGWPGLGGIASLPGIDPGWNSYVLLAHSYNPATPTDPYVGDFARSNTLAHELGHILNLVHTYNGGGALADCNQAGAEFLSDIFGLDPNCTCPHLCDWNKDPLIQEAHVPNTVVTNNLMGGNHDNYWVSALQAARMHQALKEMSVKKYIAKGCDDCLDCIAFTVRGVNHVSQGGNTKLFYQNVDLNESWAWNGQDVVAPVAGIYRFDINFVKTNTLPDVYVYLIKNGTDTIGTAWSPQCPSGWGFQGPKRAAGCVSVNARLKVGDTISTMVNSTGGANRTIAMYTFSGQLICACCYKGCYGG